jgi:hypothetical protein
MVVGNLGQYLVQFADRDGRALGRLWKHDLVPRYDGFGTSRPQKARINSYHFIAGAKTRFDSGRPVIAVRTGIFSPPFLITTFTTALVILPYLARLSLRFSLSLVIRLYKNYCTNR